jgi:hypothetical protein
MIKLAKHTFLLSAILFCGCATTFTIDPLPTKGQEENFVFGLAGVLSKKNNSSVIVRPTRTQLTSGNRPDFIIIAINKTRKNQVFDPKAISITIDGQDHRTYTYDELVQEIRRKEAWTMAAVALAGSLDYHSTSGYTYHSGNVSVSAYDGYGNRYTGQGRYSGYSYDSAKASREKARARAQTLQLIEATQADAESSIQALDLILRKTTVSPSGGEYGGMLRASKIPAPKKPHEIRLTVRFAGDDHLFFFKTYDVNQEKSNLIKN